MFLLWAATKARSVCDQTAILRIDHALRKAILLKEMEDTKIDMKMPLEGCGGGKGIMYVPYAEKLVARKGYKNEAT